MLVSCRTEDVATNDEDTASGTDVDRVENCVLEIDVLLTVDWSLTEIVDSNVDDDASDIVIDEDADADEVASVADDDNVELALLDSSTTVEEKELPKPSGVDRNVCLNVSRKTQLD